MVKKTRHATLQVIFIRSTFQEFTFQSQQYSVRFGNIV